jgi:ankyrin repeat protein
VRFRHTIALVAALQSLFAVSTASAIQPVADAAARGDFEDIVSLIAAGEDVNRPQPDGTTALLWAAYQSDSEMVAALLAAGADPNAANEFGVTPAMQAARQGNVVILRALLDAGADANVTSETGETLLMAAARAGSLDSVQLLLDRGVDPNAMESLQHQTALMWATAEKHVDVVDALLAGGADPNMQARETTLDKRSSRTDFPSGGFTALMWAARDAELELTEHLLEGGADINITNADGASALMIAIVNDRFDFAAKLLELGADPNDGSLYQAVLMRDATTDWFAKDGTQLRANYPNELTALDLTRILLEAGADPNKPFIGQLHSTSMCCDTKENGTPMFRAAVAGDVEAMKLLIEHGGDITWRPQRPEGEEGGGGPFGNQTIGKTALMVAMNGGRGVGMSGGPGDVRDGAPAPFREVSNREPVDAMRLLLEAGADPDAVTPEGGDSALHMAAKDGLSEIVALLAEHGATLDLKNSEGKTALDIVEAQEPREDQPTAGALVDRRVRAQPAEIAAQLRELMGMAPAQASLQEAQ